MYSQQSSTSQTEQKDTGSMNRHNTSRLIDFNLFSELGRKYEDNYKIDDSNSFAINNCIKWLNGFKFSQNMPQNFDTKEGKLNKGLYIAGPCGVGKTLFTKIFRDYCLKSGVYFEIDGKKIRANWEQTNATDITEDFLASGDISKYKKAAILNIEDFGSEPTICQYMGNKAEVLRQVLEYRGDRECITIITSNYPPNNEHIFNVYGERVASRLKSLNYFSINGDDRR